MGGLAKGFPSSYKDVSIIIMQIMYGKTFAGRLRVKSILIAIHSVYSNIRYFVEAIIHLSYSTTVGEVTDILLLIIYLVSKMIYTKVTSNQDTW